MQAVAPFADLLYGARCDDRLKLAFVLELEELPEMVEEYLREFPHLLVLLRLSRELAISCAEVGYLSQHSPRTAAPIRRAASSAYSPSFSAPTKKR